MRPSPSRRRGRRSDEYSQVIKSVHALMLYRRLRSGFVFTRPPFVSFQSGWRRDATIFRRLNDVATVQSQNHPLLILVLRNTISDLDYDGVLEDVCLNILLYFEGAAIKNSTLPN